MGLNAQQKEAVEYLHGPLLVLAGPGTGKTQLLSAKVAFILENTDTNPENILCITFTESGASNMRARLTSMIGKDANKVNIYTYHAFGANILGRYKNYASAIERPIDEPIDPVTQFKIIKNIQEKLPARDINKTTAIKDLVETIGHVKNNRLTSQDLAHIANVNTADSQKISETVSPILAKLKGRDKFDYAVNEVYGVIQQRLIGLISSDPIAGNIERSANSMLRELTEIITTESSQPKPKLKPLSAWKDKYFEKDQDGNYRLKDVVANLKLASLANIMTAYDAELQARNAYDFADMIEYAIKLLKEDTGFKLSLAEQFQFILLDEFQDTNPSQAELINLIADYESPCIMAVGDDDQAIFEFQGADASSLLNFQNHYNADYISLTDNYRSTGEILDFSHQIADQIESSFAKKRGINKTLRSMLDETNGIDPVAQIHRHEFITADAEYAWIAQQIQQLIAAGEDPDEIAIITPKHKYITGLLPFLEYHHINIAYEKKSNLLEDPKIHQIITIAYFIHDLASGKNATHYLMEILSFPFWEISPDLVIRTLEGSRFSNKATLDFLLESPNLKLQSVGKFFAQLVTESFNSPLELWLNYLIGETALQDFKSPYLNYYEQSLTDGELFEFFANLQTIRNTVTSHLRNENPKLPDLINTLNDYINAEASIVSTNPYQSATHAVQIVSAHKSKGLEYKHVFILATDNSAWGTSKGNNNMFVLPKNLASIRHTGTTDDECLRLFFVAITRAKRTLTLTSSQTDFNHKTTLRLEYLNEREIEDRLISPFLPEAAQEVTHHAEESDHAKILSCKAHWVSNYQTNIPDLKLLLKPRLENFKLTATDLTSFIDIIYAGPNTLYRDKILQAPSEPLTFALAYGNLVHQVFEKITTTGIDNEAAINLYQTEAEKMPLESSEIHNLIDKGTASLEISLQAFSDILRHPGSKAEVNFAAEHLIFDGVPLAGKIDHLKIDEAAKTIEVYDFKTGNYHDGKWTSHSTLYKYMIQLGFYKLLLNLSPTFSKYQITKGHILFVTPDREDKVYDRDYEYNAADEQTLKQLIKAVYHQIITLDFLERPEINLLPDENRKLKDILNFVETLISLPE